VWFCGVGKGGSTRVFAVRDDWSLCFWGAAATAQGAFGCQFG
jgi:hypothetical protein